MKRSYYFIIYGNLGKNIQTEVYDKSGKRLDLSICKQDIKIMKYLGDAKELDIDSAMDLANQGIDVFNANNAFFNDICQEFDNSNGKDIIIQDRRTDIYKNATFCEVGCSYSGMNYDLKIANCICDPSLLQSNSDNNTNIDNINKEEENNTFKALTKSFIANLFDFNFDLFKCYNLVFNLNIFISNIGLYCMASMIFLQIIFLIIFLIKRLNPLKRFMLIFNNYNPKASISFRPPKNNNSNSNINMLDNSKETKIIETYNKKIKISLKKIKEKKKSNLLDKTNCNKTNGKIKYISNYTNNYISKGKTKNSNLDKIKEEKYDKNNNNLYYTNNLEQIINFKNSKFNIPKTKIEKIKSKKEMKKINLESSKRKNKLYMKKINKKLHLYKKKILDLNRMETIEEKNKDKIISKNHQDIILLSKGNEYLQDMSYEQAILYDKRTYLRIYWAFLVDKQIILGTFFIENYLNLFVIKLSFLICTFQISFFLNAFFYTDEYISDAYHNDGVLDFFSGLPKSIYSLLATILITNLLNMLSNNKSDLMYIIRQKSKNKNYFYIAKRKLKQVRNKLIIYFIFVFLLGALFLYFVCSFCSVYRYSQKYWFIGCLESFAMDSLVSVIVCIFLALFRYLAIKKHLKCFYIIVNIISNFL